MAMLSLKVNICTQKTVKTMQFLGSMAVFEVCADIHARLGDAAGREDHSLFSPEQSRWLAPSKTLLFYDLKQGDLLEFKKKHRMLRVKLMDETIKTVLIDDSLPVQMLVLSVCNKIGISNPDEFSLAADKEHEIVKKPKKHSNDVEEGNWLNPEKSLPEQGLKDTDMLILKKKFFFSDSNIDRNDPIQLNLLYVQSRDAIISGTHPCTQEEAVQFTALQCQITHGNHEEGKHKPGVLNLKDFVPDEYRKSKEFEKKIYMEHRKLQGLTEINAKYRYVQLCRSLKTYGVTFFMVKEKDPKKLKPIPRLLGVTKESVMRMDAETKEVLKTWPLTSLRRWAASPNTFTLDFGDYQDAFYSVQTTQGDAISQLIAGYIDIIVKRKKDPEKSVTHGVEEIAISEEIIRPARAHAISITPAQANHAVEINISHQGMMAASVGGSQRVVMNAKQAKPINVTHINPVKITMGTDQNMQQAVKQRIANGFVTMNAACAEMYVPVSLPITGTDSASLAWKQQTYDTSVQSLQAYVTSHLAATCSMVKQCSQPIETVDYNILAADVATVTSNLNHISTTVRMLAALEQNEAESEGLLDAAKNINVCTSKLLTTVQASLEGASNRPELHATAQTVAAACTQLLHRLNATNVSSAAQKALMDAARAVSAATQELVNRAKAVAIETRSKENQMELIEAVKACAQVASQLAVCTAVVSPAISNTQCVDQLDDTAKLMQEAVDRVLASSEKCATGLTVQQLKESSQRVNEAIAQLMNRARNFDEFDNVNDNIKDDSITQLNPLVDAVLLSSANLLRSRGDTAAIVSGVQVLSTASTELVNAIKRKTAEPEQNKAKLISVARALAETATRMVTFAKDAAREPGNVEKQAALQQSVEELRLAANQASETDAKERALKKLYHAAKNHSVITTQLMGAATSATVLNSSLPDQTNVNRAIKKMLEINTELATALRIARDNPNDVKAYAQLIAICQKLSDPSVVLSQSASNCVPHITDPTVRSQIELLTPQVKDSLQQLNDATRAIESLGGTMDIDSAICAVRSLKDSLASNTTTDPTAVPPASYAHAQSEFRRECRKLAGAFTQLLQTSMQGNANEASAAARETAAALKTFSEASRGIATTCTEVLRTPAEQEAAERQLMEECVAVVGNAEQLLVIVREVLSPSASSTTKQKLGDSAKQLNQAVTIMIENLPNQKDFRRVTQNLTNVSLKFNNVSVEDDEGEWPVDEIETQRVSLFIASTTLSTACNSFLSFSPDNARDMRSCALDLESAFQKFVSAAKNVSILVKDSDNKSDIYKTMQVLATQSAQLVTIASVSGDAVSSPAQYRDRLAAIIQGVGKTINIMLDTCGASTPGQSECAQTMRTLSLALNRVNMLSEPIESVLKSYFDCVSKVVDETKNVANILNNSMAAARAKGIPELLVNGVQLSEHVLSIADTTSRAAYLAGCLAPNSAAGVQAVINHVNVKTAAADMAKAMDVLAHASVQQQIFDAAANISRLTNYLCGICKSALQPPNEMATVMVDEHKKSLIAIAQTLAGKTQALVIKMKQFASNITPDNCQQCITLSTNVMHEIEELVKLSAIPELCGQPAVFSAEAQEIQKSLAGGAKKVIAAAEGVIGGIRAICQSKFSTDSLFQLGVQLKAEGDTLKVLAILLKDNAPGQADLVMAIERVQTRAIEIDAAFLRSTAEGMTISSSADQQHLLELAKEIPEHVTELSHYIDELVHSSKNHSESIAASAREIPDKFEALSDSVLSLALSQTNLHTQQQCLDFMKEVSDATASILELCKICGGNPTALDVHAEIDGQCRQLKESTEKISIFLENNSDQNVSYLSAMNTIRATLKNLENIQQADCGMPQVTEAQQMGKELVDILTAMLTQAKTSQEVSHALDQVGHLYQEMSCNVVSAICAIKNPTLKQSLETSAQNLGHLLFVVCEAAYTHQHTPDIRSRQKLSSAIREVSKGVNTTIAALKEATKALNQCENAITTLMEVVLPDIEATITFAESGELSAIGAPHVLNALATLNQASLQLNDGMKAVESTTVLGEEEFGQAIEHLTTLTVAFVDASKTAAAAYGSEDRQTQVAILRECQAVADDLQTMILESMRACGKSVDSAEYQAMQEGSSSVTSHIAATCSLFGKAADVSAQPLRVLASAAVDMDQIAHSLDSNGSISDISKIGGSGTDDEYGSAQPEEVIAAAKGLMTTSAILVSTSSSNKMDELVKAAAIAKKQAVDLIRTGMASIDKAPIEKQEQMKNALKAQILALSKLYTTIQRSHEEPSSRSKMEVQAASKQVTSQVNELVAVAGSLVPEGYVDPKDPDVMAERELLAAANAIDMIAKKLMETEPPERPADAPQQDLRFDEQTIEAAKVFATATASLLRSATGCQREIAAQGKNLPKAQTMYNPNGMWSDGLVSAAKEVPAAIQQLCDAANDVIKGNGRREKVIAAARAVAASTAQVITAATVRGDANSKSQARLRGAGKSVTQATENLVKAAEQAAVFENTDKIAETTLPDTQTSARRAMFEAQTDVLAMEKELERARQRLTDVRKARYKTSQ